MRNKKILFCICMLFVSLIIIGTKPAYSPISDKTAQLSEETKGEIQPETQEPQEITVEKTDEPTEEKETPEIKETPQEKTEAKQPQEEALPQKNAEPQLPKAEHPKNVCSLSVTCKTLVNNEALSEEKRGLVPENGVIFSASDISFSEGESVFDVLKREMIENKIHLEFSITPGYNSAYIEGINNLYEFDAGAHSGWMYRVNGIFPNYGCSEYKLKSGDKIEFLYTCNLGKDIGGEYVQ